MNQLIIKAENTLEEISNYFNKEYPYLKLEFFASPHNYSEGNAMADKLDLSSKVSEVGGNGGELAIADNMTVQALEMELKAKLNLNAQVFRHSGKVWLETTSTDNWTLQEQNTRGEEAFN